MGKMGEWDGVGTGGEGSHHFHGTRTNRHAASQNIIQYNLIIIYMQYIFIYRITI